jgi:hypothetical protein
VTVIRTITISAGALALLLAASTAGAQQLDPDDLDVEADAVPVTPVTPPAPATPAAEAGSGATPPVVSLESPDALGVPRPGIRARRPPPPEEEGPPWRGPRVQLGWAHFVLPDGYGGGGAHAFTFGGYLPTGRVRLGAWTELGSRNYRLGQNDLMVRAIAAGGYQHLVERSPWLPYVVVTASMGGLFGKRFHTPASDFIYGLGLEAGLDVNLVRSFFVGLALGYSRLSFGDVAAHVFEIRMHMGL